MGTTQNNDYAPFIKWVGGKTSLIEQYQPLFPAEVNRYYEPFVGGGAIFFHLRGQHIANSYHLSDANEELVITYRAIKEQPDALIEELRLFQLRHKRDGKDHYYKVRAWDRSRGFRNRTDVRRAARFIYLNKTCFNGLWRVNQKGQFNVPMGRYKNPTILDRQRVRAASEALAPATIDQIDFEQAVADAAAGDFVYFDPPYVPLNATSNFTGYYADGFDLAEQERLAAVFADLCQRGVKVMLSNSDTQIVRDLYAGVGTIHEVYAPRRINSDANGRGAITEVVVTSY